MNNGWIKYFQDGTKEIGSDYLVNQKQASWRYGEQENIIACGIKYNKLQTKIQLLQPTYWWQSDRYKAIMGKQALLTQRYIMCLANNNLKLRWQYGSKLSDTNRIIDDIQTIQFIEVPLHTIDNNERTIHVPIYTWFVAELDIVNNKIHYRLSPERI